MHIRAVVGPDLDADLDLLAEIFAGECDALGVPGAVVVAKDVAELTAALGQASADPTGALVVVPGSMQATERLLLTCDPVRAVWFDPAATGPVDVGEGSDYLHGRGLWGLVWAVRRAVFQFGSPARRIAYGPHPDQWGELRLPATGNRRAGPSPY